MNASAYDFDNPPKNPDCYLKIREDLIEKCQEFTGYNNCESILNEDTDALLELIQLLEYRYHNVKRMLWWGKSKDLFLTFIKQFVFKQSKHDLKY